MRSNKIIVGLFLLLFLTVLIPVVSADWYNPFTWFGDNGVSLERYGQWQVEYSTDGDSWIYMPDSKKHDGEICLINNSATKINDLEDKTFYSDEKKDGKTKEEKIKVKAVQLKAKDTGFSNDIYGWCYTPTEAEKYLKFGEHSTVLTYENEVLEAKDGDNTIAKITLTSDNYYYKNDKPHVDIGFGDNLIVHTFEIDRYLPYNNLVDNIYFTNLITGQEVNKEFKLKYLTHGTVDLIGCINSSDYYGNGTLVCIEEGVVGQSQTDVWLDLTDEILNSTTNLIIGVETDVIEGEYVDVGFRFAGIDIGIYWASWSSSLNNGLKQAFYLEDNSANTNVEDVFGLNDGTSLNNTNLLSTTGYIQNGFNQLASYYMADSSINGDSSYTVSMWTKYTEGWSGCFASINNDGGTTTSGLIIGNLITAGKISIGLEAVSGSFGTTAATYNDGNWHHIIFYKDGSNYGVYIDNSTSTLASASNAGGTYSSKLIIGGCSYAGSIGARRMGYVDEVYIWDRVLTADERYALYNAQVDGVRINETDDKSPTVELGTPANETEYNSNSIGVDFTCKGIDAVNLDNLTFYLWNMSSSELINYSINTDGQNDTLETFTYTLTGGTNYSWNCLARDNLSQSAYATNNNTVFVYSIADVNPIVSLLSPTSYNASTQQNINIICNASDDINLDNVSLYKNNIINQTNTTGINNTNYTFPIILDDGDYTLLCSATDNLSQSTNSSSIRIVIDSVSPTVSIFHPNSTNNILYNGDLIDLNYSIVDTYLDNCSYNYNGTNNSLTCNTNTTFTYVTNQNNITIFGIDSFSNENSSTVNMNPLMAVDNVIYDLTVSETQETTIEINLSANSSLQNVYLIHNNTEYIMNESLSNYYSQNVTITSEMPSNISFYFIFEYGGINYTSKSYYQTKTAISFALCDVTHIYPLVNISFRDEETLASINASIPAATFTYGIASGGATKSYSYYTTDLKDNFTFCSDSDDYTFYVTPNVQYKQGTDYPQRVWNPAERIYSPNSTTQEVLYLLSATGGTYITFQVLNIVAQPLQGVDIVLTRSVSGTDVTVGQGTTDAAGAATFWVDSDFYHTALFTLEGFTDYEYTFLPTQSAYTITLSGQSGTYADYRRGIGITITPSDDYLDNDTDYDFVYVLSSSVYLLEGFGFNLYGTNDTLLASRSSTSEDGGTLTASSINTSNYSTIYMKYYWIVNDTYVNGTRYWFVESLYGSSFSLNNLFNNLSLRINNGLYGFDDFGKSMLSFFFIVVVCGLLISRYGLASEAALMGIIFGIVMFLEIGIGIIPSISLAGLNPVDNLLTIITGFILVAILLREEYR